MNGYQLHVDVKQIFCAELPDMILTVTFGVWHSVGFQVLLSDPVGTVPEHPLTANLIESTKHLK